MYLFLFVLSYRDDEKIKGEVSASFGSGSPEEDPEPVEGTLRG